MLSQQYAWDIYYICCDACVDECKVVGTIPANILGFGKWYLWQILVFHSISNIL